MLLSLIAGEQNRPVRSKAADTSRYAMFTSAVDKHASSTEPLPFNEGSEKPSQQLQQQPQSSTHAPAGASEPAMAQKPGCRPKAAGSSKPNAGPRQTDRPPGMIAPTSEKYPPDSVHRSTLQVLWQFFNFPDEAAFRVFVAIDAVRNLAAQYAEQLLHPVSRVSALPRSHSVRYTSHQGHVSCLVCPKHEDQQALLSE